jgi:hypothetical protein
VLADAAKSDAERLEALAFLVHFVQDIHQPLHANANGDRGGNEVRVRFLGEDGFLGRDGQLRPFNLHGVWDTRLLPHVLKPDGSGRGEIAAMVDAYGELWREPDERVWARESNHWAWRRAQWPLPVPLTCGAPPRETVDLDQAYVDQAAPVVRQRLAQAAVRLRDELEEALSGDAANAGAVLADDAVSQTSRHAHGLNGR